MEEHDSGAFFKELFDLEGKVAVVIGGTGVLCGAMAWGLWRVGCRVVLVGRNRGKAESHFQQWGSSPDEARFFKADVTRRDQVVTIIPAVTEWFGRIDIWINGAAINPPIPYFDMSDEEFERILDVNLNPKLGTRMGWPWDSGQRPLSRFLSGGTEPKSSGRITGKGHYGPHPHGAIRGCGRADWCDPVARLRESW